MTFRPCHKAGMKKKTLNPTRSKFSILRQVCNFIPPHLVSKIARTTGAEDKSRTFTPWSHVVSHLYAQLTHSIGLNDLCDSLQIKQTLQLADFLGHNANAVRDFYEPMGQQTGQTRASKAALARRHVKIPNRVLQSTLIFLRKSKGIRPIFRLQGCH